MTPGEFNVIQILKNGLDFLQNCHVQYIWSETISTTTGRTAVSWPVEELYVWETPIYKSLQGRLAQTCWLLQHHRGVRSSGCQIFQCLIKYLLNQWHSHQPLLYVVISVAFKWSEHKLLYVGGKDLVFIRCIYLVPLVAGTDKLMVYYRLSSSCNIKVRNQLKQYYVGYKLYMQIPGFPDNIGTDELTS